MPHQVGNQLRVAHPRVRLPASSAAAERSSRLRGRSPSCSAFCRRLGLAFSVRSLLINILFSRRTRTRVSPLSATILERCSTNRRSVPQRMPAIVPASRRARQYSKDRFCGEVVKASTGSCGETRDIRAIPTSTSSVACDHRRGKLKGGEKDAARHSDQWQPDIARRQARA